MMMEDNDVVFRHPHRFLMNETTVDGTTQPATGTSSSHVAPNDSVVIRSTLRTYGTMYLVLIVLFCILRVKFPRAFNVRSWSPHYNATDDDDNDNDDDEVNNHANNHDTTKTKNVAKVNHFGALDWFWKVWYISDDDFREQCGMDALAFVRIYRFGLHIAIVGMFNSLWLLPVYGSSPIVKGSNSYITDPLAMVTVGYVPPGSPRLIATVIAAYIQFGAIMYLMLQEFKWFTYHRHLYLSARVARNYTVYVSHIPSEYRTSAKLIDYFRSCFSHDAVLEAHVALDIPQLEKTAQTRDALVNRLEHAINIEQVTGKTPTHRSSLTGIQRINTIDALEEDLKAINEEIRQRINEIEEKNDPVSFKDDLEAEGGSIKFNPKKFPYILESGGYLSEHSSLTIDMEPERVKFEPNLTDVYEEETDERDPFEQDAPDASVLTSSDDDIKRTSTGFNLLSSVKSTTKNVASNVKATTQTVASNVKSTTINVASNVKSTTQQAASTVKSATTNVAAMGLALLRSQDGKPREAGFVTFANLKTTQAALQQIHHETPFVFEVAEAPEPDDIFWVNVGRDHKSLQIGKLISFALTGWLCLFWTIPVAFIVSLTEVESLKKTLPFLNDWVEAWPTLNLVLAQMAPLVLILIKMLLPIILGIFSALEGPVSSSVLEASLFYKLAIFEIIQTFFVSTLSGSILSQITAIIEDWTYGIKLLANSIPGQSAFFVQIIFVQTFLGQGLELLRVTPLAISWIRKFLGPNLTEKERNTTWMGLRPLADPSEFEFADIVSNGMLYFMVMFVYGPMAPVTNWFLAFCFVIMISGYRHQLIFNYPPTPDSGGQLWIGFIGIAQTGMLIGQVTLAGYLALKRGTIAFPLMIPLIVTTILFKYYINQRHLLVTKHLPSRAALKRDLQYHNEHPNYQQDIMSMVHRAYVQPAMQSKDDVYPENYDDDGARVIDQSAYMTPPGSEADLVEEADGRLEP